jgi:hypothetical protein
MIHALAARGRNTKNVVVDDQGGFLGKLKKWRECPRLKTEKCCLSVPAQSILKIIVQNIADRRPTGGRPRIAARSFPRRRESSSLQIVDACTLR